MIKDIYFIYDGECPLCNNAAQALRIRKNYGTLHLINARTERHHLLIAEVNRRGLDLDDGMVIVSGDDFYHGKNALRFMAQYGDKQFELMNGINWLLFRSDKMAALCYPVLRGIRNLLLRLKNVERIDNLNKQDAPIFKSIFGAAWDDLPPVMKKHYANRPYTDDVVTVEGTLDVFCGGWIKWFTPLFALMRSIPPWSEKSVPVTVHFRSDKHTRRFHFERVFRFTGRKPYRFRSYMVQITGNDVAEITGAAMGWRMRYGWEGGKVVMRHNGYVLRLFGHYIPVPLELLIGEGYAEETPVDDNTFDMVMHLTHPKWGKIYEYRGRFGVVEKVR